MCKPKKVSSSMLDRTPILKTQVDKTGNCIVISQPMYFPWAGMLEQVQMSNVFVHYEDVQFTRGSFSNRVQVKTESGMRWLTVPLRNHVLGQPINEVEIDYRTNWQKSHKSILMQAYAKSKYKSDMLDLIDEVFLHKYDNLADLSKASLMGLIYYFDLDKGRTFIDSPCLGIDGSGTRRVIDICIRFNASIYLTGHGAKNYLEHEAFEAKGIDVNYMRYGLTPYEQLHGESTPYVTALDLVANCGKDGRIYIAGNSSPWRKFIAEQISI
jgi:hypothetical protein